MSLYTKFVSTILFPSHERLKHHSTVDVRKQMEKTQWLSAAQLHKYQIRCLKKFLSEVNQHVPYYNRLFETVSFEPDQLNSPDDLVAIPFLTKQLIRENIDSLKSDKAVSLSRFNTGGSSGEPLIFYLGNERVSHDVAAKWRATRWWGVDIGDPEIVVWGSPIELGSQDYVRQIRDKLIRTHLLEAFEMSEAKLSSFVAKIRKVRPKMLFGYPSSLALIVDYAEKTNERLDNLGVKVAFVTSEKLYDEQRSKIERGFACPVANGYGGRDAGFIAHECPAGNMHITAEDIIVEIIDQQGNVLGEGEAGEIVVTHMATSEFPFIRYRTGDIGVLGYEKCSCNRSLPILKEIQGRTTDFIVASDGTVMHGLALIYVLRDIRGIEQFKIIQEDLLAIRIQIKTNNEYDANQNNNICEQFKKRLGSDVNIVIEKMTEIPPEKSGKYRYVVSNIR